MGKKRVFLVLVWDTTPPGAREQGGAPMDRRAQPGGEEGHRRRVKDHKLLVAQEEPLAQSDRAQEVGAWQAARVVEADGLLSADELAERVCSAFGCPHYEHLAVPEKVA